jgi:hypothetical protein
MTVASRDGAMAIDFVYRYYLDETPGLAADDDREATPTSTEVASASAGTS